MDCLSAHAACLGGHPFFVACCKARPTRISGTLHVVFCCWSFCPRLLGARDGVNLLASGYRSCSSDRLTRSVKLSDGPVKFLSRHSLRMLVSHSAIACQMFGSDIALRRSISSAGKSIGGPHRNGAIRSLFHLTCLPLCKPASRFRPFGRNVALSASSGGFS